ncbi:MAG: hypothetical protein GC206_01765 [Alphaproteobacteria bacterium]|nr:hypothetical protein [Alphaproteobacteria bacterium]
MTLALLTHVYVRKGKAIIPVVAATDSGWLDVEPVEILDAGDLEAVKRVVLARARKGNPPGPTYLRGDHPEPVVLRSVSARSWAAFAKGTAVISLDLEDGALIVAELRDLGAKGGTGPVSTIAKFEASVGLEFAADTVARRVADLASGRK